MNQIDNSQNFDYLDALQARLDRLQYWRGHIIKALKRGQALTTFTDVVNTIVMGQRLLFDNGKSFAIVQPDQNTMGLGYYIYIAGGEYKALCELEEIIVTFAKHMGAVRLSTLGRDGFLRRQRPNGWVPTKQSYFIKEI
jgi:hypothetical protein